MVATMTDPDLIDGKLAEIQDAILGSAYRCEGIYLEIRDSNGEPLVRTDTAFRAGTGSVWFAPGMDEQFGIPHGGRAP